MKIKTTEGKDAKLEPRTKIAGKKEFKQRFNSNKYKGDGLMLEKKIKGETVESATV